GVSIDGVDLLVHNAACKIAKFNVPRTRGVYTIHFKDGTKYVGKAFQKGGMHKRVERHFQAGGKYEGKGVCSVGRITTQPWRGRLKLLENATMSRYGGPRSRILPYNLSWG